MVPSAVAGGFSTGGLGFAGGGVTELLVDFAAVSFEVEEAGVLFSVFSFSRGFFSFTMIRTVRLTESFFFFAVKVKAYRPG
ncbi:hypothetical protein G15_3326 [Enterococcus avium]|nr:hypothetical protein G15_3326 [Enterococcus avium]